MKELKITWHSILPPKDILERTKAELQEMLDDKLENPGKLIYHVVIWEDEPLVQCWGVKGDDAFHAEYNAMATWGSVEEFCSGVGLENTQGIAIPMESEFGQRIMELVKEAEESSDD